MTESKAEPWYVSAFDESYVRRYAHRDQEEAEQQIATLLDRGVVRVGTRVLDLCCGAGRHSEILARVGITPVGVDLSADLLRAAHDRLVTTLPSHPPRLARVDMSQLPFASATFDAVIQMFTAFGYFVDDDRNRQVLREVARVLTPSGTHTLDLMNLRPTVENLIPISIDTLEDGSTVEQRRSFDPNSRRVEKVIETRRPSGDVERREESVRVFDLNEIEGWYRAVGMTVIDALGNYDGAPYVEASSPRMVIIARRDVAPPPTP